MSEMKLIAEPGKQEITMSRSFDAPRELVYKAYTDPDLLPQWWGPEGLTTIVDKMEVKPGGTWRYVQRDDEGNEYGFHGVYHTTIAPERLVHTFEFEGMPGHVLLETITFEEKDGKTIMTDSSVFQSVADRDGMLSSGMEDGATQSMERFAKLLLQVA